MQLNKDNKYQLQIGDLLKDEYCTYKIIDIEEGYYHQPTLTFTTEIIELHKEYNGYFGVNHYKVGKIERYGSSTYYGMEIKLVERAGCPTEGE